MSDYTWLGVDRSPYKQFSARIQLSGAEIAASQQQEGAFIRAAREEWAAIALAQTQQFERNALYFHGRQWLTCYGDSWDPDMEMDIGL